MHRRLPVMLVGGFLGAGKTSLLHHFISHHEGGYLALLVENPSEPNLDAKVLRGLLGAMRRPHDLVVEIPPWDDAAQTGWLAEQLRALAESGRFERVLIETSGTANAARLAPHFASGADREGTFAPWAELEQIVCVVDALDFHHSQPGPSRTAADAALADFQRLQIEGAGLIVLNKCDLLDRGPRDACLKRLCEINPDAPLVEAAFGEVPPEAWARRPSLRRQMEPGSEAVAASALPDLPLAGALFRAHRPFHPGRFWNWFQADHAGLWRVKGIAWLATRNLIVGGISRTRRQTGCGGAGIWWAALPREDWPREPEILARMQETWREPYGDRRQELVLLGEAARLAEVTRGLNACLLTDREYARPVAEWRNFPDPFPVWDMGEDG